MLVGNMEMSKQISAKLMAFITENETFVNLSQLAQYNGMTVKATELYIELPTRNP